MFIRFTYCISYWFIISYYPNIFNACKRSTFIIIYLYLSKKQTKINIIALANGLIEYLGDTIMNLALMTFACILGFRNILDNQRFQK